MLQDERIPEHNNLMGKWPNRVLANVCFALRGYSASWTSVRKPKSTTRGVILQLCLPRQGHWLHQTQLCNLGLVGRTGNVWGQLRSGSGDLAGAAVASMNKGCRVGLKKKPPGILTWSLFALLRGTFDELIQLSNTLFSKEWNILSPIRLQNHH